jgi:hypothetical protein
MLELELLRAIAPETRTPSAAAYARARAELRRRMSVPARRSARRWLLPAGGVAASAAAAAAIFLSVGTGGEATASASAALRQAAATAARQAPPEALAPGQYLYTKSVNAYLNTGVYENGTSYSVLVPNIREIWLGRDGTGWLVQKSGEPTFLSERDRAAWVDAGRPAPGEDRMDMKLENTDLPDVPMYSLDLPSDPDVLFERLERDAGSGGTSLEDEMFTLVGDALRENYAMPEQRAALYEVAARIPGVELLGEMTDGAGRLGIAVARDDEANRIRYTLIFDPETAALLGEQQVVLAGNWAGYPEGTVIGHATYVESAIVDEIKERPKT